MVNLTTMHLTDEEEEQEIQDAVEAKVTAVEARLKVLEGIF